MRDKEGERRPEDATTTVWLGMSCTVINFLCENEDQIRFLWMQHPFLMSSHKSYHSPSFSLLLSLFCCINITSQPASHPLIRGTNNPSFRVTDH